MLKAISPETQNSVTEQATKTGDAFKTDQENVRDFGFHLIFIHHAWAKMKIMVKLFDQEKRRIYYISKTFGLYSFADINHAIEKEDSPNQASTKSAGEKRSTT